jgi:hypothetical protein
MSHWEPTPYHFPPDPEDPGHFVVAEEDVDELTADRTRRWTTRTIIVAALFMLVFNAHSLQVWSAAMKPNWATQTIREISNIWADRVAQLGLDEPRARVREAYERLKGQAPGDATVDPGTTQDAEPPPPSNASPP